MVSSNRDANLREVASILARGYLRQGSSQDPEPASIAPSREPATGSPNCLDVVGRAEHELESEGHP